MTKKVRTITGDVPPEALGRTLIHEHLCVDWGDLLGRPKVLDFDRDEMADRMVAKMDELYAVGIGAMTECTPIRPGPLSRFVSGCRPPQQGQAHLLDRVFSRVLGADAPLRAADGY